ncbi:MAG: hypothetical protein ACOYOS_20920 [Syntrophales bacterium]
MTTEAAMLTAMATRFFLLMGSSFYYGLNQYDYEYQTVKKCQGIFMAGEKVVSCCLRFVLTHFLSGRHFVDSRKLAENSYQGHPCYLNNKLGSIT